MIWSVNTKMGNKIDFYNISDEIGWHVSIKFQMIENKWIT